MKTLEPTCTTWRTSSYTTASEGGTNCVEIRDTMSQVRIRDTKDRSGGELSFGHAPWRAFLRSATS
ncbi:DUF397 domain-containing protein [Amycolatopsis minnesotensis]|uniref:DUF397 domain-containing protein n=1 Tax=Amycolatopsis minnesotensis TaxID=337894 RepID=A0ABN2R2A6_9PSEU